MTEQSIEEEARAAAERLYPPDHEVDDPFGETGVARSDPYGYDETARSGYVAGYIAGASREPAPAETHDENTLHKVYDALTGEGMLSRVQARDVLTEMQNAGILFRERVVEGEAKLLQNSTPADEREEFPETVKLLRENAVELGIVTEREALSELLMTIYDHGTLPNAFREANAILAAGFTRHPQPTEGGLTDAQVLAALNARELSVRTRSGTAKHFNPAPDLSYYSEGNIEDTCAALRAAGVVADQGGGNR